MNRDSESLQHQLFNWLVADDASYIREYTSVECKENHGEENSTDEATACKSGAFESELTPQNFQLGEIPTVQERFQAVLKRRLQKQIQNHPPLFPWETQLAEYPEYIDNPSIALVPSWGWMLQQNKLNLPVLLPEKVFGELLERCQALVASSLPLGAKLVQAVDGVFPQEQPQALNDIAGLVLRTPYRSVDTLETLPSMEREYSNLQTPQQIALSLLAAKRLIENLTLAVSKANPFVERLWETNAGILRIEVEYFHENEKTQLRVNVNLPTAGCLKLKTSKSQIDSHSNSEGNLSAVLDSPQLDKNYILEIECPEIEKKSLHLGIVITD
ncbi:MAG: PatU [Cyanobacteria bacterium P01_A01_bin.45]